MKKLLILTLAVIMVVCCFSACQQKVGEDVVSPMHNYDSVSAMTDAVGFPVMELSDSNRYIAQSYDSIDDEIAQIIYTKGEKGDGSEEITVRSAKGSEDFSGVQDPKYTDSELYGATIHVSLSSDVNVMWFAYGDYCYSLSTTGIDDTEFENIYKDMVGQATNDLVGVQFEE